MITRRNSLALGTALGTAGLATPALAQQRPLANLPATMIWSVYDVGSAGYVEASAISDALGRAHGTRVRLQPSGTSIGRILPLKQRRASHAWLANELYFAAEGIYEYATPDWGPQDFRVLMGRKNAFSVVATKESGITKPEDLKGKRMAWVPANSSVNIKVMPVLAFAGLTLADVELVQFPSYVASLRALIEGRADCAGAAVNTSVLRELEASPRGISWVQLDPGNARGWEAMRSVVSFAEPIAETIGSGVSAANPANVMGYRYPMITVNADTPDDEVYALMKAVDDSFALYKDVNATMPRWAMAEAGTPPMDAAFHPGAVKFLREKGQWTAETQTWQDGMIRRNNALRTAWAEFLPGARSQAPEAFAAAWNERRTAVLASIS